MMNQMLNASAAAAAAAAASTSSSSIGGAGHLDSIDLKEKKPAATNNDDSMSSEKDLVSGGADELDEATAAQKSVLSSFSALLNYNKHLLGGSEATNVGGAIDVAGGGFGNNCNMQPFLFECLEDGVDDNGGGDLNANFVPCMVYLPVKSKLASSVTLRVALKPLDLSAISSSSSSGGKTSTTTATTATASESAIINNNDNDDGDLDEENA